LDRNLEMTGDLKDAVRQLADCLQVAVLLAARLDPEHAALRDAITQAAQALSRFKPDVPRP
jgi:hypothetical protein